MHDGHARPSAATDLSRRVVAKFLEVNGVHLMTPADDAYVDRYYRTVDVVCANRLESPDEVRSGMLAGRLPIPGYLRSDGTEMLPSDYFRLADEAGGVDELESWFLQHWSDHGHAVAEWQFYLNGQYVCLRSTTPLLIQRKDELTAQIVAALARPDPRSAVWLDRLHLLVDELDELTVEFTAYDRLRFGGPVSRDTFINDVRTDYPNRGSNSGRRINRSGDEPLRAHSP